MEKNFISGRTLARCQALQVIFQAEATGRSVDDVLDGSYVLSDNPKALADAAAFVAEEPEVEGNLAVTSGPIDPFGEELARGVGARRDEVDGVISHFSKRWEVSRMPAVDRNLMRLAVYEMLEEDETPIATTIDEAVTLAKAFGGDESSKFINGVLGTIAAAVQNGEDVMAAYGRPAAEVPEAGLVAEDDAPATELDEARSESDGE